MTHREKNRSSRIVHRVLACAVIGVVLASCGSDDDASSSTAATVTAATAAAPTSVASEGSSSSSGDLCEDREALRTSVAALEDVDLAAEGTDGLTAAITAVKDDLAALGDSAGDELQPQVQAVQDGIDELEAAAGELGSGGASEAATALSTVSGAAGTLLASLEEGACG